MRRSGSARSRNRLHERMKLIPRRRPSGRCKREPAGIPAPPFPRQHQRKPGSEAALNPPPLYDAPFYLGSKKLADKVALITGRRFRHRSGGGHLFAREGADVAVAYLNEHEDARITKEKVEAEGRRCLLIAGDVSEAEILRQGGRADGQGIRTARRAGEQRGLSGPYIAVRRPDREAFRRDAEDQSLRLFLHGAGRGEAR